MDRSVMTSLLRDEAWAGSSGWEGLEWLCHLLDPGRRTLSTPTLWGMSGCTAPTGLGQGLLVSSETLLLVAQ